MVNRYGTELAPRSRRSTASSALDDLRSVGELVGIGGEVRPPPATRSHAVFDTRDPRRLTTPGYGYLKVAEGCDNPCTFCAIPSWRGQFRSRSIESLVAEAVRRGSRGLGSSVWWRRTRLDTARTWAWAGTVWCDSSRRCWRDRRFRWMRFSMPTRPPSMMSLLHLMGTEAGFVSYVDMPLQH